jgi:hypothetical protein
MFFSLFYDVTSTSKRPLSLRKGEGKRPSEGQWRKREDNIKMLLKETRLNGMNWIHLN